MDNEKTELEKRWEEEEGWEEADEEVTDNILNEENANFIMNLLNPKEALVVAFVGPRAIIGGLESVNRENGQLVLSFPIIYAEEGSRDPQGKLSRRPVLARLMNFAAIPESMVVNPEFFHLLTNKIQKNLSLAAAYENTIKLFFAEDAEIIMPTEAEVHDINRPRIVK